MTGEHTITAKFHSRRAVAGARSPTGRVISRPRLPSRSASSWPSAISPPGSRPSTRPQRTALPTAPLATRWPKRVIKPPPSSARPTRGVRERASRSKICAASTTTDGVTGACAARTKCSITRGSFAGRKAGPTRAGRRASSPSPTRPGSISPRPSNSPARTNSWFTSPISSRVGTAPACAPSSCGKGADPRRRALVGARGRGRSVKVVLNRPFRRA